MSEERYPQHRITGRGSARQPASAFGRTEFCSWTATVAACEERLRASSWDDSDGESFDEPEILGSRTRRIYTFDDKKEGMGSVAYEINELKKQFFEGLRVENEKAKKVENVSERPEKRVISDRRQSPARIRRRTKSSNSPSPVREATSQVSSEENEIDQVSIKSVECESKHYLNNFLSDLKSKRMGGDDSNALVVRDDGGPIYDRECVEMYNQLHNTETKDAEGYLCKTSRKLSQILEVEENRKDLEKKSEENLELFRRNFRRPEELSPLETARSRTSARFFDEDKFKTLHFEEFGNFHTIPRHAKGSLSDRTAVIFQPKIHDEFISLSAKSGKTQIPAPGRDDSEVPLQYFCFTNPMVRNMSRDIFPRERGRHSESRESLKMEQGKNSTSRKSTERSERRTDRTWSGKSRSDLPESPRFSLSIDSARSLKVEDVESNESVKKSENENHSSQIGRKSHGSDGVNSVDSLQKSQQHLDDPNKANSDTSRSEVSIDQKQEKRLGTPYSSSESIKQKELNQASYRSQRRGASSRREGMISGSKTPEGFHSGRRTHRPSGRSIDDRYREERPTKPDSATWSKLIDTFQGGSTHSFRLDSHFPGFPRQRENSWDSDAKVVLNGQKPASGKREGNREATDGRFLQNKSPLLSPTKDVDDDLKNCDLDFKDFLLQKIKKEDVLSSLQSPQNLFYFNVNDRGAFKIGEFGDVTYCTAVNVTERLQITGNSDTVDYGKPKDHGDGIPTQKAPGVITLPATDKREKDKTQRQFWTELRRDFRATPYGAEDVYFPRFIPIGLKKSKSDNCINLRIHEEIHAADHKPKNVETSVGDREKTQKEAKPPSKPGSESSRSESLSEDLEFECERTPRMSKSLSDLDTKAKDGADSVKSIGQLLETTTSDQKETKEASNLNEFLESRAEDKLEPKSNWLSLRRDSNERAKKSKTKSKRKGEGSPKEPFHDFLTPIKGREPVPPLKLRNSNCFQNFYKRFISVFCLTSNSAATSK